jgi:hypothetical protein
MGFAMVVEECGVAALLYDHGKTHITEKGLR